eukprot:scaffold1041_cov414-Prasinococcus_capsulatus_cf.AAC.2
MDGRQAARRSHRDIAPLAIAGGWAPLARALCGPARRAVAHADAARPYRQRPEGPAATNLPRPCPTRQGERRAAAHRT